MQYIQLWIDLAMPMSLTPLPIPSSANVPFSIRVKLGCIAHRDISWIFDIGLFIGGTPMSLRQRQKLAGDQPKDFTA